MKAQKGKFGRSCSAARWAALLVTALVSGCGAKSLDIGEQNAGGSAGAGGGPPDTPPDGSTAIITHQRGAMWLTSEREHLYWEVREGTLAEIRRCEKVDCAGTVASVVQLPIGAAIIAVRGQTLYLATGGFVGSCAVTGCGTPVRVVENAHPAQAVIDDSRVYWAQPTDTAILTCPLTGCEKANDAVVAGVFAVALAVDDKNIYFATIENTPATRELFFAPKDGSAAPTSMAKGVGNIDRLRVDGGFLYWNILSPKGQIGRCPVAGCSSAGPEILIDGQAYPRFINIDGDILVWMSEADANSRASSVERTIEIRSCQLSNCAATVEVRAKGRGGGLDLRNASSIPPQLALDAQAFYWVGDIVAINPDAALFAFDSSIRRMAR
jgi:hypothetical protein